MTLITSWFKYFSTWQKWYFCISQDRFVKKKKWIPFILYKNTIYISVGSKSWKLFAQQEYTFSNLCSCMMHVLFKSWLIKKLRFLEPTDRIYALLRNWWKSTSLKGCVRDFVFKIPLRRSMFWWHYSKSYNDRIIPQRYQYTRCQPEKIYFST